MWEKLSLWHIDLIPLIFHSRKNCWVIHQSYTSVRYSQICEMFPFISLRQLVFHLFGKSHTNRNKYQSIVICVLSLSITKPETTCMSSLESVCSGQLPVFFICYLLTGLFGFCMYREQRTAWNCPLALGEDASSCRFFFSLCLWFLVLKTPTFVLLLELWWEQQKFQAIWGNLPLLFSYSSGF